MLGFFKNKKFNNLPELKKGTNWVTLTEKAIKHICNYVDKNKSYYDSFKYSLIADEIFFHTIINDSEFLANVYKNDQVRSECFRYIDWSTGPDYPRKLDESDTSSMRESEMLFARKIKESVDIQSMIYKLF